MTPNAADGWPTDPIAAVVHPDPYPYYVDLSGHSIRWDDALGLWVAASAADVAAVLAHPAARVRPVDQPVPAAFADSVAGDVFGRLVRMNDRPDRIDLKAAINTAVGGITSAMLDAAATASARRLSSRHGPLDGAFLDRWCAEFPVGVIAHLVGVGDDGLDAAATAARTVAACFGPVPPTDSGVAAPVAVDALRALVAAAGGRSGLATTLSDLVGDARAIDALVNTVGLFFQTFDATAGLVGSTLVRLARGASVPEPSVHNTRRFFAEPADIGGAHIDAGDVVLVVLAAAALPFGAGAHQCPASALVPPIVEHAVEALQNFWPGALSFALPTAYRPLPNTRVPVFGTPGDRPR